jgi:hypothetical protein
MEIKALTAAKTAARNDEPEQHKAWAIMDNYRVNGADK